MEHYIIKDENARELSNVIRTNYLGVDGYADPKVQQLIDNQAATDNRKIKEALALLESYKSMGVTCYDENLKFLIS